MFNSILKQTVSLKMNLKDFWYIGSSFIPIFNISQSKISGFAKSKSLTKEVILKPIIKNAEIGRHNRKKIKFKSMPLIRYLYIQYQIYHISYQFRRIESEKRKLYN